MRCIQTEADLHEGIRVLRRKCKVMRQVHDVVGLPPMRLRAPGFEGLARIIVGQQVSVASADAIWSRFETAVQPMSVEQLRRVSDEALRAAGMSRPKIRTFRAIAEARALDFAHLTATTDDEVHSLLTSISGIGPWTADVYLLFCLGRADAFAAGDLALQVAAQHAFGLERRPAPLELTEMAQNWRPWRGVAARLLWTYYRKVKAAKSGLPV
ncbi:MAG: DNA-3-methyladenine glycosylase 2 family protein [Sphingomonadales bacterium]|nr:DNA-3-methyladenine glycosylase 2 family protein [Sphingomonadales bacterium]